MTNEFEPITAAAAATLPTTTITTSTVGSAMPDLGRILPMFMSPLRYDHGRSELGGRRWRTVLCCDRVVVGAGRDRLIDVDVGRCGARRHVQERIARTRRRGLTLPHQ